MQMEQATVAASHFLLKNPVGILNQYLSVHATLHIDLSVDFPVSPPGLSTPGFAPLPTTYMKAITNSSLELNIQLISKEEHQRHFLCFGTCFTTLKQAEKHTLQRQDDLHSS